jgi:hypothetical protein
MIMVSHHHTRTALQPTSDVDVDVDVEKIIIMPVITNALLKTMPIFIIYIK